MQCILIKHYPGNRNGSPFCFVVISLHPFLLLLNTLMINYLLFSSEPQS